jgi:hypothetical protein
LDIDNRLLVLLLKPDVGNGSPECVDVLDEMSILDVSMNIGNAKSDISDIESEVDAPNDETSNSKEVMCC